MKSGIKDIAGEVAVKAREAEYARQQLLKRLEACRKEIGGVECSFVANLNGLHVTIGDKHFDPEVFANICNWFGKHWSQGDDGYETEPAADPVTP